MDLTNEDVTDVLALLDSLPYDELDLQTTRFRLILRRTPDGWTQSTQVLSEPNSLATIPTAHRGGDNDAEGPSLLPGAGAGEADEANGETGGGGATGEDRGEAGRGIGGHGKAGGEIGVVGEDRGEAGAGSGVVGEDRGEAGRGIGVTDGGRGTVSGAGEAGGEPGEGPGTAALELVAVRAPLPGTFYRAPRPGAPPFVEVGSRVGADTVIGIVETMKLMNSVPAGVAGTVAEICLANAEFAVQGVTLLHIRADP
jgi:hypothetical protein